MKKQIMITATAMMLAAGAVAGSGVDEVQAASKKIAINKKTFPDQVFRELVRVNYDKNKDKKLSKKEIKKAKKFGTSSCKNSVKIKPSKYEKYERKYVADIKNFKGIEKLSNLQKFVANGTGVKTVNLKKNKKLTYLEMTDGKLQNLNLNNNKKLNYVYLQYNPLTSLKINQCKKLYEVDLTGHMVQDLKINHNKRTVVHGEEYYMPFERTKVKETFAKNDGGQLDVKGNYCVYQWGEDYSSCTKKTWNGTELVEETVTLNADAIAKTKGLQLITAQWQDVQGNFYFVADKDGDMVEKTVNYLYKVDDKGAIVDEIKVNDQMIFAEEFYGRCALSFMNQENGVVALKMTTAGDKAGVLFFDMNTMQVTKQVICDFAPLALEGDVVAGRRFSSGDLVVSKIVKGEMKKLSDTEKELEVVNLTSAHSIEVPTRTGFSAYSVSIKDNYLYLISSSGFYKAKLTANSFQQIYGVGKLFGLQEDEMYYTMIMKSEKEIYLMSYKVEEDDDKESGAYTLQVGKIQ